MTTKKTIEDRIYEHIEGIHRLCDKSGQSIALLKPSVLQHYSAANYFINILMKKDSEKGKKYREDLKELPHQFQEYKDLFPQYIES